MSGAIISPAGAECESINQGICIHRIITDPHTLIGIFAIDVGGISQGE
jgi:hypothetical protein